MKRSHVLIPVYNAYEDLKICVESLIEYTDLTEHQLVFINDNSTDRNIKPFLDSIEGENIIVLHNEENKGFSATINRGIESCTGDVILLNSDTIVTKCWIEKITACAYSDMSIGTVTPLSNNATLCSVPEFCKENELPTGYTVDEFADLIESWSMRKYPQITVAHGFCMFIKREVINRIGLFDDKTFRRGYGEENDFCFRAEQIGYHHVMCDDTFIYHKGTSSFLSEEKKIYIEKNAKILETEYNEQWEKNQKYCSVVREKGIRQNIEIALKINNKKKNILYLVQADFREDASNNIGGTQLHVKDLMLGLKEKYNVFVAARDGEYLRLTAYIDKEKISYKFFIDKVPDYYIFRDERQKNIYRNILKAFSIDIVHVHHTLGLSLDLYYEAKSLGIPLMATLHDFYYVCPNIKLLNNNGELCIGRETKEMCKECLKVQCKISTKVNFIENWRKENHKALKLCDKLITPSKNARGIFLEYFSDLEDKIEVIEHGSEIKFKDMECSKENLVVSDALKYNIEYIFNNPTNRNLIEGWAYIENSDSTNSKIFIYIKDEFKNERLLEANIFERRDVASATRNEHLYCGFSLMLPRDIFENGKLSIKVVVKNNGEYVTHVDGEKVDYELYKKKENFHVAFIGGMSPAKGSQLAYNVIKNSNKNIDWYVFGGIGDDDLASLEKENLTKTGWYKREDILSLVKLYKIDVICILPIWPETFCYTLSEALLCKVPVIVTDIGAVGDRVKSMECGWVIPKECKYEDVLNLVYHINNTPQEYEEKYNIVKSLQVRKLSDMISDYDRLYCSNEITIPKKSDFNVKAIYKAYLLGNNMVNCDSEYRENITERIHELEDELNAIYESKGYKALILIRTLNIPFKDKLKFILFKCYKFIKKLTKTR